MLVNLWHRSVCYDIDHIRDFFEIPVSSAEITKPTKTVEVVENKVATLNFHVNQPGQNACWYKNGIELDLAANSRYVFLSKMLSSKTHQWHH